MKRTLLIALAALGFSANVHAQDFSEDIIVVLGNSQSAAAVLVEGLGDTGVTLVETSSTVQTTEALGDALIASGQAATLGAPNLGQLGSLGFGILVNANLAPATGILAAVDDPANFGDVFNPDDLTTIAANLPGVTGPPISNEFGNAVGGVLEGNMGSATLGVLGLMNGVQNNLFGDTNYSSTGSVPVGAPLVGTSLVLAVGAGAVLFEPLNDALEPTVEAWDPYVNQSFLGLPSLADTVDNLDLSDPLGQLALAE